MSEWRDGKDGTLKGNATLKPSSGGPVGESAPRRKRSGMTMFDRAVWLFAVFGLLWLVFRPRDVYVEPPKGPPPAPLPSKLSEVQGLSDFDRSMLIYFEKLEAEKESRLQAEDARRQFHERAAERASQEYFDRIHAAEEARQRAAGLR